MTSGRVDATKDRRLQCNIDVGVVISVVTQVDIFMK